MGSLTPYNVLSSNNQTLQTPAGVINGVNTVFTLTNAPSPASTMQLFNNGILQYAAGVNYTLAGLTITFAVAPVAGDLLRAYYYF